MAIIEEYFLEKGKVYHLDTVYSILAFIHPDTDYLQSSGFFKEGSCVYLFADDPDYDEDAVADDAGNEIKMLKAIKIKVEKSAQ